jgi:restriction endonuclease S subunit
MFGDPAANPKRWPVKRVDEITQCLDRLRRPVTESDRKPGNVPYYGANGQQGWIDTALFDEPLVLVAEDGGYFDAPERGVAYRIDGPAWVNNHAHILRVLPQHVDTEFLHWALRHFNFLPYISGTTRAKLTQGQLNSVKLFVPPLQLQRDFGQRVAGVLRIAGVTARSGEQLDALFTSLQCRAFRGDLLRSAVGQPSV